MSTFDEIPVSSTQPDPPKHRPVLVREVLRHLRPSAGDIAVDCTLGGGAHARAILERIQPGGTLVGLDVDSVELPRTEANLRRHGFGRDAFIARHANFARLPDVLAQEGMRAADLILVDLGVSSMQSDDPARGFSFRIDGPLDMRMDPSRGGSALHLITRATETELARVLAGCADEPHAGEIARLLKEKVPRTTQALDRVIRSGLAAKQPALTRPELKMSVRRTLQALRIAVNDELAALDALLQALPACLAPKGRAVFLTFHSGEDRRVKKAFQAGQRAGIYSAIARDVVRSTKEETRANRRASSAKLRWAVRA